MMFKNIDRMITALQRIIERPAAEVSIDQLGREWTRIGAIDNVGRRSVWMREHVFDPGLSLDDRLDELATRQSTGRPTWIEICGGREGDDFEMILDAHNPQYVELYNLLQFLRFVVEPFASPEYRRARVEDVLNHHYPARGAFSSPSTRAETDAILDEIIEAARP